jgi:hypothetical protein
MAVANVYQSNYLPKKLVEVILFLGTRIKFWVVYVTLAGGDQTAVCKSVLPKMTRWVRSGIKRGVTVLVAGHVITTVVFAHALLDFTG